MARAILLARRGLRRQAGRTVAWLLAGACVYLALVAGAGLVAPRKIYAPGARRCFDDWCVAAVDAVPSVTPPPYACAPTGAERAWIVTLRVSSAARRVRQRARDASAALEDDRGRRHTPCAPAFDYPRPPGQAAAHVYSLTDALDPGESFVVHQAYVLRAGARPVGVMVRHGAFPDVLIPGADQGLLHPATLLRLEVRAR